MFHPNSFESAQTPAGRLELTLEPVHQLEGARKLDHILALANLGVPGLGLGGQPDDEPVLLLAGIFFIHTSPPYAGQGSKGGVAKAWQGVLYRIQKDNHSNEKRSHFLDIFDADVRNILDTHV